jgi:hypothetical protein
LCSTPDFYQSKLFILIYTHGVETNLNSGQRATTSLHTQNNANPYWQQPGKAGSHCGPGIKIWLRNAPALFEVCQYAAGCPQKLLPVMDY